MLPKNRCILFVKGLILLCLLSSSSCSNRSDGLYIIDKESLKPIFDEIMIENSSAFGQLMAERLFENAELFLELRNDSIRLAGFVAGESFYHAYGSKDEILKNADMLNMSIEDIKITQSSVSLILKDHQLVFNDTKSEDDISKYNLIKGSKDQFGWSETKVVDEFGDDTGKIAIMGLFEGSYDNSYSKNEMTARIGIQYSDDNNPYTVIELFQYGNTKARIESDFYGMQLKNSQGNIEEITLFGSESQNALYDSGDKFYDYMLAQSYEFGVLIKVPNFDSFTDYVFKVDPKGLQELIDIDVTETITLEEEIVNEPVITNDRKSADSLSSDIVQNVGKSNSSTNPLIEVTPVQNKEAQNSIVQHAPKQEYSIQFFTSSYSNKSFADIEHIGRMVTTPKGNLTMYHIVVDSPDKLYEVQKYYKDAFLVE